MDLNYTVRIGPSELRDLETGWIEKMQSEAIMGITPIIIPST
jgi:hypothetical protein